MRRKLIGIFICMLLIATAVLPVTHAINKGNVELVKPQNMDEEPYSISNNGELIDNVTRIRFHGTWPTDVFWSWLYTILNINNPTNYVCLGYGNGNDVNITVNAYFNITTPDDRLIYEDTLHFKDPAHWGTTYYTLKRSDLIKSNYLTGVFKLYLDFHIVEDGSYKKLLFYGYFFNYGSIIFNPSGKLIE